MNCELCAAPFTKTQLSRRFCSRHCQTIAKQRRKSMLAPKTEREIRPPRIRRLFCHHCGGKHRGDQCRNRAPAVRHYGTIVNGEYVPYPGAKVRVIAVPNTVDGQQLTRILKEMP